MKLSKKIITGITISVIVTLLVAIDLGLFRKFSPYNYSIIRHLYCITIEQEEYSHISPLSRYPSSMDYLSIFQCGNEYDEKYPPG
ncbi:hypothetical protein ACFL3C_03270 [Patescibacteria group bacterium]